MSDWDGLAEAVESLAQNQAPDLGVVGKKFPKGLEPTLEWDGRKGHVGGRVSDPSPGAWEEQILRDWDLDPAEVEIVGLVQRRSWDAAIGGGEVQRMHYVKANIQRRRPDGADLDELIAEVRKWRPPRMAKRVTPTDPIAYVYCSGDLQAGKADGDGTPGMTRRFLRGIGEAKHRLWELQRIKRPVGPIYLPWLGDCIEHVGGFYQMQTFTVQLSLTEQLRLVRRLMLQQIKTMAPLTDQLVVPVVPGNHDEAVRVGGKASTDFSDSFAIDLAAQVHDALAFNAEMFGHVNVVVPKRNRLELVLDICGTTTGMIHGHQVPNSGKSPIDDWWSKQGHGMQDIGHATLLLTAHFHHLHIRRQGPKQFIQIPQLDGGSDWHEHRTGQHSPPGIVTLTVGNGRWGDFHLIEE